MLKLWKTWLCEALIRITAIEKRLRNEWLFTSTNWNENMTILFIREQTRLSTNLLLLDRVFSHTSNRPFNQNSNWTGTWLQPIISCCWLVIIWEAYYMKKKCRYLHSAGSHFCEAVVEQCFWLPVCANLESMFYFSIWNKCTAHRMRSRKTSANTTVLIKCLFQMVLSHILEL